MGLSRTGIGAEYRRDLGQNDGLKHAILTDRETSLDECLRLQASCMAPQGSALADCDFYHSMISPGVGKIIGLWDLRQTVDDYLGRIDFAGKRVLEIGPASGFLAIEMERRGADVVAVELPEGIG